MVDALAYINKHQFVLRLGIRNVVHAKDDLYFLLFYDIDRATLLDFEIQVIDKIMQDGKIAYILYTTKHGYHLIGLTPIDAILWSYCFTSLKKQFRQRYAGNTIRLDRKDGEIKNLVKMNLDYGHVIPNLYNLVLSRLDNVKEIKRIDCKPPFDHKVQIERYRSYKN